MTLYEIRQIIQKSELNRPNCRTETRQFLLGLENNYQVALTLTLNQKWFDKCGQMRVDHYLSKDDIPYIDYYQNYNKVLDKENPYPNYIRKIQQNISCVVPGLANLTQKENIRTARGSQNGVNIGFPQKMFSYMFYGNQDYYDLPNAF